MRIGEFGLSENSRLPEIAIVGMGCLFPDSPSPSALWQHVVQAQSTTRNVPQGRWFMSADQAIAEGVQADRVYSQKGCFIRPEDIQIKHDLFDISPELFAQLDPLFHVLFHAAGAAVDDSGDFETWNHEKSGVIMGNLVLPTETASSLSRECILNGIFPKGETHALNLYAAGMPSGMLAKALGLGGTSFTLDAACASSLYALKLAMDELQTGRADVMLTGGVSRPDALYTQMGFSQLHALSKRGKSSPFDAQGDGLVVGEGSGILVLKRLTDAQRAGNQIYGVIRGVGLSNDLAGKLLAPSSEGQLRAMRAAYKQANWSPSDVSLIECHATGTPLGDAVEFSSLQTLWAERDEGDTCVLGSIKSNIGHTLTAAGSAAIIKVLLAMKHKTLPPTAHFQQASTDLAMHTSPFHVLQQAEPWSQQRETRKVAVSAFGFGGINAHVLLEEYIPKVESQPVPMMIQVDSTIAVVGLAAQLGDAKGVDDISRFLFQKNSPDMKPSRDWGTGEQDRGYFISKLALTQAKFRIPPKEMTEMLPQQLLMLQLASQAWDDAALNMVSSERTAVYIGVGLDMNSTNFHLRWALEAYQDDKNISLDRIQTLKDGLTPALNANRTMGSLGSVVASRIARELGCGGPSFTLSSEGASGVHALAAAMHALKVGEIDTAIVGAVDMQGDVRVLKHRQTDGVATEGGIVLVLQRSEGQAAYARVKAVEVRQLVQQVKKDTRAEVMTGLNTCWGHMGAADGLAYVYAAVLCLHQHRLVANHQRELAQYWLHDTEQGERQALVLHRSVEYSQSRVLLAEAEVRKGGVPSLAGEYLCVFSDVNTASILLTLRKLQQRIDENSCLRSLANRLLQDPVRGLIRVALVARSLSELQQQLQILCDHLQTNPQQAIGGEYPSLNHICARDRMFYQPDRKWLGDVAFIFPGSGNHFHGMGRDLFFCWPQLLDIQQEKTTTLATQFQDQYLWHRHHKEENQTACILGHVSLGIAVSDALQRSGVHVHAAIPHSLGETVAFFSLGVWHERDNMLKRMLKTRLFTHELHSEGLAARKHWQLEISEKVQWRLCVVDATAEQVEVALIERTYLLIINTSQQCVIGGQGTQVEKVVEMLNVTPVWLDGVSIAHCDVVEEVAEQYRALHYFPSTIQPDHIVFYSDVTTKPLTAIDADSAADSRLSHALHTLDYPSTIEQAYADGVRVFIEIGPGRSCTQMIQQVLNDKPHMARAVCYAGESSTSTFLRTLASLYVLDFSLNLDWLVTPVHSEVQKMFHIPIVSGEWRGSDVCATQCTDVLMQAQPKTPISFRQTNTMTETPIEKESNTMADSNHTNDVLIQQEHQVPYMVAEHLASLQRIEVSNALAHQSFLSCSQNMTGNILAHAQAQLRLVQMVTEVPTTTVLGDKVQKTVVLNRAQCVEFAVGSIAKVFGADFSEVDDYPIRVRLPDEPLMLVDDVVLLEAEPNSMSYGRIVTHHYVGARSWYLDQGHIPVCIAVEAGQADLMLAGYLGIDSLAKGQAVYRLLDAAVVFHDNLPTQGQVIEYDIYVDHFFEHEGTWFMRFHFEGTVDGKPLISMKDGCAGFFSQQALDDGEGIKLNQWEKQLSQGKLPQTWPRWVDMQQESYNEAQLNQLRKGDLHCFGSAFKHRVSKALTIPQGKMNLVHRVSCIEPQGGRFGLGRIVAEADIAADDWFLTCHFVDDKVMPGTLMYECCNHTLRLFLMRMGWISEAATSWWGPVQGVQTRLKCRGQVLDSTSVVTYEIVIQEMGYRPEPYAIAEANMYADGKFIVRFDQMSIQLNGSDQHVLQKIWQKSVTPKKKTAIYDKSRIVAFSEGLPSVAFGDRYQVFDQQRKIARLPRDPYAFLDRITAVSGEPWVMQAGASAQAQYDVPEDAWYFEQNRQESMAFAILLEIALQPCGWLAGYVGSALSSDVDLRFRNLGGKATQYLAVTPRSGTLTIDVRLTRVSSSAGMIIQSYDMSVCGAEGLVYEGVTDFGFFSQQALDNQVGVVGATLHDIADMPWQDYPVYAPYPDRQMRMQDHISLFQPDGGPSGLGLIRGHKQIDAHEWFFKAHFYQDPVNPGSLGLEAMMQLLKVLAVYRWKGNESMQFQSVALDESHEWVYRGQVVPINKDVTVEAWLTEVDDTKQILWADGVLQVDGKVIYQMKRFSLQAK